MAQITYNGVEYIDTPEAARWLGRKESTLRGQHYKDELKPILIGWKMWWPKDKVLALDMREFDGRYK